MVSSRPFLIPILLLITIPSTTDQAAALAQPQPATDHMLNHFCSNDKGNYTTNDAYGRNLKHLLSSLPSNGNGYGFYSSSYGRNTTTGAVYTIGLCKGDISTTHDCLRCLNTSRSALMDLCPKQKEAIVWYENCMLRYSYRPLYGVMDTLPAFDVWSTQSLPSSEFDEFSQQLRWLLDSLRSKAAAGGSLKFAKNNATYSNGSLSLTALAQCTPDLSELQCSSCLLGAFEDLPKCCDGKESGRVLRPSCNFNYQLNQVTGVIVQPKGVDVDITPNSGRSARYRRLVGTLIPSAMVNVVSLVLMISIGIYTKVAKTRPQPILGMKHNIHEKMDEHMAMKSLHFDCADIRVATNNFSEANKLGVDGYGTVYRGSLANEKSIAVRRLSLNYVKEYMEIEKQVLLMAPKLQHPNLVELLGCALDEKFGRLLVYEFFPNTTLDRIIFDQIKSRQWDWEMRYNIIVSIARGLLHLHDSHFVHGNVNASNIMIDAQMNPKISNSGIARFFAVDQTQENNNGIHMPKLMSNTYLAAEEIDGHSSAASDVYSFGVLVVEIISGQEISSLPTEKLNEKDLLSFAWENWAQGTLRYIIDPMLWTGSGIELMESCIRVGLLCMQRTRSDRPTMSSVIQMLSHSSTVPPPYKYRDGSFGIIGVSEPRSGAKVQSFIAKMRTSIIKKMGRI